MTELERRATEYTIRSYIEGYRAAVADAVKFAKREANRKEFTQSWRDCANEIKAAIERLAEKETSDE